MKQRTAADIAEIIAKCANAQLSQVKVPSVSNACDNLLRDVIGERSFLALCRAIAGNAAMVLSEDADDSDGVPIERGGSSEHTDRTVDNTMPDGAHEKRSADLDAFIASGK